MMLSLAGIPASSFTKGPPSPPSNPSSSKCPTPRPPTPSTLPRSGLDNQVGLRASEAPTTGLRGFTLSLVVSQPATVDGLIGAALDAGATPLKPAKKGFWGYGGLVRAPDGTIWKVATSSRKDTGPATRQIDEIVLLLGVADVAASKRSYVERGLEVARSFGRKYVQFATGHVKLALYGRHALAKAPASPRTAPARTESSLAAMPAPSPTRTDSPGSRWAAYDVRPSRLRRPRSRRQPDPHPGAALSRPALADMT